MSFTVNALSRSVENMQTQVSSHLSSAVIENISNRIQPPSPMVFSGKSLQNRIGVIPTEKEVTLPDGSKYKGLMKEGKFDGLGELTTLSGKVCQGVFNKGNFTCGNVRFPAGSSYMGAIKNGAFHGRGTLQFQDGRIYSGVFEGGDLKKGTIHWPDGSICSGPIKNWQLHGKGTFKFLDGRIYSGVFEGGGLKRGTIHWYNGDFYEGFLKNGSPHGKGRMEFLQWKKIYEGSFKDGCFHGFGAIFEIKPYTLEEVIPDRKEKIFEGHFVMGSREGRGTYYNNKGEALSGTCHNNRLVADSSYILHPVFLSSLLKKTLFFSCADVVAIVNSYWKEKRIYPELVAIFEETLRLHDLPERVCAQEIFAGLTSNSPKSYVILVDSTTHAMVLEMIPQEETVVFKIYNAGEGGHFHQSNGEIPPRYQTVLQMDLPKRNISEDFIHNFTTKKKHFSTEQIYYFLIHFPGAQRIEPQDPIYQKPQIGPNCVLKSPFVFLVQMLGKEEYYKMRIDLFDACIKGLQASSDPEALKYMPLLLAKKERTEKKLAEIQAFSTRKRMRRAKVLAKSKIKTLKKNKRV